MPASLNHFRDAIMWNCDHCGARYIDSGHECLEMALFWLKRETDPQKRAGWLEAVDRATKPLTGYTNPDPQSV